MKNNIFKNILKSKGLKYGSNSVILIAAVIIIALFVNVIVTMADIKVDMTANKIYSLSDATKNILKDLKQDITIVGLFDKTKVASEEQKAVIELLKMYQKYSHINVQYVDPDKNPGIIKELDPENTMDLASDDFVVKTITNGKDKKKRLSYDDLFVTQTDSTTYETYSIGSNAEQGFSGAIKYVISINTPVVYFTQGHNEDSVDESFTNVKDFLQKNNYVVNTLTLSSLQTIPSDAAVVIVASPKSDLSVAERAVLDNYLASGGNAVFMFDYLASDPDLTQFNTLLGEYNLAVGYDKVKENDSSRHLPNDDYTFMADVNVSNINESAFNVVLSGARSIRILKNPNDNLTDTSLMQTSSTAVAEVVSASRGTNLIGPIDLAVAAELSGNSASSKILVMGSSSFINDESATTFGSSYYNNIVFFVQSVNWMIGSNEEMIVASKNYEDLKITVTQLQTTELGVILIVVLPLIILSIGVFIFLRRRHL